MILFVVGFVAVATGLWYGWPRWSPYRSAMGIFMVSFLAGVMLTVAACGAGCDKLSVQGKLASVAALRQAAAAVDLEQSEDIYGKVADFNSELASQQWLNRQWWGDAFVPDEWDTVQAIPISRKKETHK